ncbi:MAG: hypothetical protein R3A10_13935 [Caldilineaceae bacterium]
MGVALMLISIFTLLSLFTGSRGSLTGADSRRAGAGVRRGCLGLSPGDGGAGPVAGHPRHGAHGGHGGNAPAGRSAVFHRLRHRGQPAHGGR